MAESLPTRKPLSKRVRFEVFTRDAFRCHYCGAAPEMAELQVDHVVPVAMGGTNHIDNLTTACAQCNSGKSAHALPRPILVEAGSDLSNMLARLAEIEEQARRRRDLWLARQCISGQCETMLRWLSLHADAIDDVSKEWPWRAAGLAELVRGLEATGYVCANGRQAVEETRRGSTRVSLNIRAFWPNADGNCPEQWRLSEWYSPDSFPSVESIYA